MLTSSVLLSMIPAVVTLLGLGVLWGALKAQVGFLKEEVDRLADQLDRQDHLLSGLQEEVRVKFAQHQATSAKRHQHRRK